MQALVSSGLAGTTQAAGLGKKFEEEVGAPTRLKAQDIAFQRLSGAETQKVGFIERREDVGPDFATIAGLTQTIGRGRGFAPTRQPDPSHFDIAGSFFGAEAKASRIASQARADARATSREAEARASRAASDRKLREHQARLRSRRLSR